MLKGFALSLYSPFFFPDYYELERGMKCTKIFFFPSCQFFRHSCVASDYNLIIACAKYEIFALPFNTAIHARAYDL